MVIGILGGVLTFGLAGGFVAVTFISAGGRVMRCTIATTAAADLKDQLDVTRHDRFVAPPDRGRRTSVAAPACRVPDGNDGA